MKGLCHLGKELGNHKVVSLGERGRCLFILTLLHSEQPKLHRVLAVLSAIGLNQQIKD